MGILIRLLGGIIGTMQGIRYFLNDVSGDIEIKKCNNSIHSNKTHFHNEISMGLIESGYSNTKVYDNEYKLTEGTFLIIPANVPHKCTPHDYHHWKFKMFYINKEWFESEFNIDNKNIEFSYMKLNQDMYLKIAELFNNIESKKMNIENESKLLKTISILNKNNYADTNGKLCGNINLIKINEVKEYLDENYLKNIKLIDLAKIANISKYYLIKKFEECYGLPPHQYIINLRINYAKKLLKSNNDFADIALKSKFYDQSHFAKYFKDYTGVTPLEYKSSLQD